VGGDRSSGSAAHALADGIARVLAAPLILAATIAVVAIYGPHHDLRHVTGALLLWAFLSGGTLDRYARQRATRARGFFAACGGHLAAMLRLGLTMVLVMGAFHLAIGGGFPNAAVHEAAFAVALIMVLLLTVAQVRIAVEDRRSALGALLAAARFVARNPAVILLFALFALAELGAMLAGERFQPDSADWLPAGKAGSVFLGVETFLLLTWYAVATALFQSRLAHARYTAVPPLEWPESPAAEAIGNRRGAST
jgi:hypothetical protein